jgi:diguanylate cyclase (GGDEF)-like protein/PAS domain S-box-containing protein
MAPLDWQQLFGACVEQAYDAVVITDARIDFPGPSIIYVNPAFEAMTGYSREEVLGRTPRILQGPRTDRTTLDRMRRALETGQFFEGRAVNYRKDGSAFHMEWSVSPVRDPQGTITHFIAVQRDITPQVVLENELERRATTDPLTGLFNRLRMEEFLTTELSRLRRYGGEATLLLLDIDHFKAINDRHGHHIGDRVLKELGGLLQSQSREADVLARWGGEEFVLLAPETFAPEGEAMAQKLRETVAGHDFPVLDRVTVSMGLVTLQPGSTITGIMRQADRALYSAKGAGRNRLEHA